jgi:hypothetical protein
MLHFEITLKRITFLVFINEGYEISITFYVDCFSTPSFVIRFC